MKSFPESGDLFWPKCDFQQSVRKHEQSVGILQFGFNELWEYSGSIWADPEHTIFFWYSPIMYNNIWLLPFVFHQTIFENRAKPFSCSVFILLSSCVLE